MRPQPSTEGQTATVKSPKVTVLMTVYNGMTYLPEAIDSVLGQTFEDFEFLIVDDGSTDESVHLVKSYSDPRIRLVQNEKNLGQPAAMNIGLKTARGEYIARFDSDDICFPTRLERQVEMLDSNPDISLVGSWMQIIDENGRYREVRKGVLHSYAHYLFSLLACRHWLYHPSVTLRRSVFDELGGYDENLTEAEDFDLWVRLAQAGHDARIIQERLICYRRHSQQKSCANKGIQAHTKHRIHRRMLASYLNGFPVERVNFFLRQEATFWRGASFSWMRSFTTALKNMLDNIRAHTGMRDQDYVELKERFGELAQTIAIKTIPESGRLASVPLFLFAASEKPDSIFSRGSVIYALTFLGPLLWARSIRKRLSGQS